MNPRDLLRLLFPERQSVPRGRAPDSPEWYHGANLLYRAEASIVMSIYRRLRTADFSGGEALLGAYRQYVGVCQPPHRISFDRAFDLAAHTDGLWLTESRSFSLVVCPACHSEFLAAFGSVAMSNDQCPFCKLVQRYGTDPRVQSSFPTRPSVLADRRAGRFLTRRNVRRHLPSSGGLNGLRGHCFVQKSVRIRSCTNSLGVMPALRRVPFNSCGIASLTWALGIFTFSPLSIR
jgi:flagellar transcriptional activator FlhC